MTLLDVVVLAEVIISINCTNIFHGLLKGPSREWHRGPINGGNSGNGGIRYDAQRRCAHELPSRTVLRAALLRKVWRISGGAGILGVPQWLWGSSRLGMWRMQLSVRNI